MEQTMNTPKNGPRKIPLTLGLALCLVWAVQAVQSFMETGTVDGLQVIGLLCAVALVVHEFTCKAPRQ